MGYNDGNIVRRTDNNTWQASADEDFFFKAFFNTPVSPIENIVTVDFREGDFSFGAIINDSGSLITDIKFIVAALVDDTSSMSWSDPVSVGYQLKSFLPDFFTTLFSRTAQVSVANYPGYNNDKYQTSYLDFWLFSNVEINRSLGYSNSISSIRTYSSSLYQRGFKSSLLETSPLVINGLNYQSIIDSFIKPDEPGETAARIDYLVKYLVQRSSLRLNDIYDYWVSQDESNRSDWGDNYTTTPDKTSYINTIKDYNDVSDFVVSRWAKTFLPMAMIFSDGDNNIKNLSKVTLSTSAANAAWGDDGIPIYSFGLGRSHRESALRTMADESSGIHFHISSSSDWALAQNSLLHGGSNSLYTAYWTKLYDYASPVWISKITAVYSSTNINTGRSCKVEVRWSEDRINFTSWQDISSGEQSGIVLKKEIAVLEYKATLRDGWNSNTSTVDYASITYLKHTEVSPSILFLVTPPQKIDGMMFETLLNATSALPDTASAVWGICRGNSVDFGDFLPVHLSRKGALPNRQQGIEFTKEIIDLQLPTELTDPLTFKYTVLTADRSSIRTWSATDIVTVYFNEVFVVRPAYLDGNTGTLIFDTDASANTVTVDIKSPSTLYKTIGEITTTNDYRTYYLTNGRWPNDSTVVVIVNGNIVLGGYSQNPEEGSITFFRERESTDVVSAYVENTDVYRVGLQIKNYDSSVDSNGDPIPIVLDNFSLYFSTLSNTKFLENLGKTRPPVLLIDENNLYVRINPRVLNPQGNVIQPTIFKRLTVSYKYFSEDKIPEFGTEIKWYRYRLNFDTSSFNKKIIINGLTYVQLTENQIYNYDNRLTQKKIHVGDLSENAIFKAGDKFFVTVLPSDGYNTGAIYSSEIITIQSDQEPYILTLKPAPSTNTTGGTIQNPSKALTVSVSNVLSNFLPGVYKVGYTYSNSTGETAISSLQTITLTANKSIQIKLPANFQEPGATSVNFYCSVTPGSNNVYMAVQTADFTLDTVISQIMNQVFISSPTLSYNENGEATSRSGSNLSARYTFKNPSGAESNNDNQSVIEWYEVDTNSLILKGTRADNLNSSLVKVGKTYNYKITPFNGSRYGEPVFSSDITIIN